MLTSKKLKLNAPLMCTTNNFKFRTEALIAFISLTSFPNLKERVVCNKVDSLEVTVILRESYSEVFQNPERLQSRSTVRSNKTVPVRGR